MRDALHIRRLVFADALDVQRLMRAQTDAYMQYFTPFPPNNVSLWQMLKDARFDLYVGIFWTRQLIGLFMLRGWDEGYDIPSFGMLIDESHANLNLGRVCAELALAHAKLYGASRILVKAHPDNLPARHLYEDLGFKYSGIDESSKNLMYHRDVTTDANEDALQSRGAGRPRPPEIPQEHDLGSDRPPTGRSG